MALTGNLRIRKLRASDVDAVYALSQDLGLSRWSRSDLREELKRRDSFLLLAVFDNDPVGFVVGRRVPGSNEGTLDAEIYNIGVVTRFHKKGIGGKLINSFFAWANANKIISVWLEVRAANLSAVRFYKRYGFEEIVTRKGFYSDPLDDAVVMKAEVPAYYNVLNKESLK